MDSLMRQVCGIRGASPLDLRNTLEYESQRNDFVPNKPDLRAPRIPARDAETVGCWIGEAGEAGAF